MRGNIGTIHGLLTTYMVSQLPVADWCRLSELLESAAKDTTWYSWSWTQLWPVKAWYNYQALRSFNNLLNGLDLWLHRPQLEHLQPIIKWMAHEVQSRLALSLARDRRVHDPISGTITDSQYSSWYTLHKCIVAHLWVWRSLTSISRASPSNVKYVTTNRLTHPCVTNALVW